MSWPALCFSKEEPKTGNGWGQRGTIWRNPPAPPCWGFPPRLQQGGQGKGDEQSPWSPGTGPPQKGRRGCRQTCGYLPALPAPGCWKRDAPHPRPHTALTLQHGHGRPQLSLPVSVGCRAGWPRLPRGCEEQPRSAEPPAGICRSEPCIYTASARLK